MEAIEADPVADIESLDFVAAPGENVRGDEKLAKGESGEGAAIGVIVEDHFAEVVLSTPPLRESGDFGRSGGNGRTRENPFSRDDLCRTGGRIDEEGVEFLLTERDQFAQVRVELGPHLAIKFCRPWKAFDSAELQRRIERGQVAELHGYTGRRSVHRQRQIDDDLLPLVEESERDLVVEVEDDEELVAGPIHGGVWTVLVESQLLPIHPPFSFADPRDRDTAGKTSRFPIMIFNQPEKCLSGSPPTGERT